MAAADHRKAALDFGQAGQRLLQHRRQPAKLDLREASTLLLTAKRPSAAVSSGRALRSSPMTQTWTGSRTRRCSASA